MNKLRSIRYFAFFMLLCAEYRYVSNETWPDKVRRLINEASSVEPFEKMKVDVQNLMLQNNRGYFVKSYARQSLTLITNEHLTQQKRESGSSGESLPEARAYYQFKIRLTNSDSTSEVIFTLWGVQIKKFVYFSNTGSRIKLLPMPEFHEGIITVDFLNPSDAQLFWYYASKQYFRRENHVTDALRFQIFHRQTKEKLEESSFIVILKEWAPKITPTYTISLQCRNGDMHKPLLIFTSGRFSVSEMIEDRLGLLLSDEPNMVFILQFSPFDNDAAVRFHEDVRNRRSQPLHPISDDELRTFID